MAVQNYDLLYGYRKDKPEGRQKWLLITGKLNKMGPTKSTAQWRDCFYTMIQQVKRKMFQEQQNQPTQFNELDHLIMGIISQTGWTKIQVDGADSAKDANNIKRSKPKVCILTLTKPIGYIKFDHTKIYYI